jgi:Domain of unknown function (DUF222)
MCTGGDGVPGDVAEALRNISTALDHLNGPAGVAAIEAAGQGDALAALARVAAKLAAARATALSRFDAARGHDADGYGSSVSWLAARNRVTRKAAAADVRRMRQLRRHPLIAQALAAGEVSESWAAEIADWTRKLPAELREGVDKLLLDTAAAGANLEDLAIVARAVYEKWRSQEPDPDDDDGFEDRFLKLGTTFGNAGRITGDLTPECTAAVQAVLDALGKKAGPEDQRTEAQRYHDALQLACDLLLRADLVPGRAGADTRVDAVIDLARLLDLPGASELTEAWLAALAGEHGYLDGTDAETAACDALVTPVVTGHPDLAIVDQMIDLVLAFLDTAGEAEEDAAGATEGEAGRGGEAGEDAAGEDAAGEAGHSGGAAEEAVGGAGAAAPGAAVGKAPGTPGSASDRAGTLSPEAWRAVQYAIARLAVDLVAGPDRLASILRRGLLDAPYASKSVILDVGLSASVPAHIRRAVQLRARHCEWPGCDKPPVHCDVHHLRHQADGGETSLRNCVLLCQFHHDVCIHRWGWRLVLHPDGTTTTYGPKGQVLHSHGPGGTGPPGGGPPGSGPPRDGPSGTRAPRGTQAA